MAKGVPALFLGAEPCQQGWAVSGMGAPWWGWAEGTEFTHVVVVHCSPWSPRETCLDEGRRDV